MKNKLPFIIAEVAQGFEGSKKLVELYVKAAVSVGADAIKFQIFYADELALPDYTYYYLFKGLELPFEVWGRAVKESHQKGLEFYSDVFGIKSFKALDRIGVDGYKIHSTDINNISLLKAVANVKKKVFLSTGGCQLDEINRALDIFSECDVTLMYGFQAEPTTIKDNNLNRIRTLIGMYNRPVGFQDHTDGNSEYSFYLPFVALGAGVNLIEKHLTLSREAKIEDCISALTPEEFALWSKAIRKVYASLGKKDWKLTKKEADYRVKVRRAVCSVKNIEKGKIINKNDITLKRANDSKAIFNIEQVLCKKAKEYIKKDSTITRDSLA